MCISLSLSDCCIVFKGIPVQPDITSATSSSVTVVCMIFFSSSHSLRLEANFSRTSFSSAFILAAFSKSSSLMAIIFASPILLSSFSSSLISLGGVKVLSLTFDEASSIKSIALSGRLLSETYLSESITAETTALSVIVIP